MRSNKFDLTKRNTRHKGMTNLKMNDDVYLLRRKVIDFIYEVNNEIVRLPRLNVRITNDPIKESFLGVASINSDRIVWIPKKTLTLPKGDQRYIVYHEILHSAYGIRHSSDGGIMQPIVQYGLNKQQVQNLFRKELDKYNIQHR